MKKAVIISLISGLFLVTLAFKAFYHHPQGGDPWTKDQLIAPADLAKVITTHKGKTPKIYSIGFEAGIPGSIVMGPVSDKTNLDKFTTALTKLPKNTYLVVYCGCCPFVHCPNVRPAVRLLKEMGFTNFRLLDLEHNLKADWIDKGYPMDK